MSLTKATLKNVSKRLAGPEDTIELKLNPTEYTMTRGASYAEIAVPGLSMPVLQFVRGESQTVSMELFLDGSDERRSVKDRLDALRKLAEVDGELHAPPVCQLTWWDKPLQGVVTALNERFLMFAENGDILRARVTLTMKRYMSAEEQVCEQNKHSPDCAKTRVVRQGERLDMIAEDEYGDPSLWPVIARANDIVRPRLLHPGTVLQIPPL